MMVPVAPNWIVWAVFIMTALATLGTVINEKVSATTKFFQFLLAPVMLWVVLQALR